MNGKGCGRKPYWPNLRYYPGIYLETLKIATKTLVQIFGVSAQTETGNLPEYNRHRLSHVARWFWEELIAYFPWYDTGHIVNDASNNSSIFACVFDTAVTFLPSRFLATMRRLLPSRCLATIGGIHRHTHTQQRDLISLLLFFQNK
jgi:hypothetical protein